MQNESTWIKRHENIIWIVLFLAWIISCLISLSTGHFATPLSDIFDVIKSLITGAEVTNPQTSAVLIHVRFPRIILASLVGAALAASGAVYQGVFKNPLVSPDILGVSNGACLGAVIGIFFKLPDVATQVLAFAGGLCAVFLVAILAKVIGKGNGTIIIMILSGTVVSSVFNALITLIKYVADTDETLPAITYWLMGSFGRTSSYRSILTLLIIFILAIIPLLMLRWKLNALSFGDEEAQSMGVDVNKTRMILIICSTLLTSASVAFTGVVGWVGLIVPHMIRLISGSNYRSLLPNSIIGGAAFMVLADCVTRNLQTELPISVLTSLIGATLFIVILIKGRKDWL